MAGINNPCAMLHNMITQAPDEAMANHFRTTKSDLRQKPLQSDIYPLSLGLVILRMQLERLLCKGKLLKNIS